MKESVWGYLILVLGIVIIAILLLVQRFTTINEEDYYLSREIMKAAMVDAIDFGSYGRTGELVMSKEKFVEVYLRRFAESVSNSKSYRLEFYDIHEYPPKATVRIVTNSGETQIDSDSFDVNINTYISGILETTAPGDVTN